MSGAKHTPGPWEVKPPNEESPNRFTIVTSKAPHWLIAETVPYILGDPDEANALLIAAAPDMLAALEEAERALSGYAPPCFDNEYAAPCFDGVLGNVRAAIAKARGA